jgi:hypothetical protein
MSVPKKRIRNLQTIHEEDDQAIEELAEAVIENMPAPSPTNQSLEPFDQYVQRMRYKIYSEARHFKERLAKGYQVLLAELAKEQSSKE